jgi:hypothetical protein
MHLVNPAALPEAPLATAPPPPHHQQQQQRQIRNTCVQLTSSFILYTASFSFKTYCAYPA